MAELNYKQIFEDYIRAGSDSVKKEKAIKKILELAIHKIIDSNEMKKYYPDFKGKINFLLTNSGSPKSQDNQQKNDSELLTGFKQSSTMLDEEMILNVPINIDFGSIENEPPDVVYAGFYATIHNAMFKKAIEMENGGEGTLIKTDDKQQKKESTEVEKKESTEVEKTDLKLVVDYIKDKILKLFGIKDADSAIKSFTEDFKDKNGGVGLEQEWYDFSFTKSAQLAHAGRMATKAQQALLDGDPELANGLRSQGMILAASMSDSDFKVLVDGNDKVALREFAENYAITYLRANGVDPRNVDITLKNEGALGTFYPAQVPGGRCTVNINVVEIEKMKNPTEVAMTLSHELRHSIDATQASQLNGDKQARLQFNITEAVGLGDPRRDENKHTYQKNGVGDPNYSKDVKAYDILLTLKNDCYYVNPNERMARIAELSALEFMKIKAKGDKGVKQYIIRSAEGFIAYQVDTKTAIEKVLKDGYLENQRAAFNSIGLASNDPLYEMLENRLGYLNFVKGSLNTKAEENAIAQAKQLIAELEGRQVAQQNQREATQGRVQE